MYIFMRSKNTSLHPKTSPPPFGLSLFHAYFDYYLISIKKTMLGIGRKKRIEPRERGAPSDKFLKIITRIIGTGSNGP